MNVSMWIGAGLLATLAAQPPPTYRIATIEFFGQKGIDTTALRKTLPVHEGDELGISPRKEMTLLRQAVTSAIGREPTDVNVTCCDSKHGLLVYIGLAGASYRPFVYDAAPEGNARLSKSIVELEARLGKAIEAAVLKGGDAVSEDDSRGYMLVKDPAVRALQLAVRRYALRQEAELVRVVESSSNVEERRMASEVLGYARQSRRQVMALVHAARDPDDEVRNNATRAVAVLVRSHAPVARDIPAATFIDMLSGGIWTDRNKGTMVVEQLTTSRDPTLLARLRADALDSLIEMAAWRETGHAYLSRLILGRIAGIPERRLEQLADEGSAEIIAALSRRND